MRRALSAIALGLALGAGVLGFAIDESSGASSTTPTRVQSTLAPSGRLPTSSPSAATPAAHDDSNTDDDEDVFLNENVIEGKPTTICT